MRQRKPSRATFLLLSPLIAAIWIRGNVIRCLISSIFTCSLFLFYMDLCDDLKSRQSFDMSKDARFFAVLLITRSGGVGEGRSGGGEGGGGGVVFLAYTTCSLMFFIFARPCRERALLVWLAQVDK